ncbi:MAG: dihydrofolate reductase [Planctomycetota bacterium]|jgi:dihydrofolate reductase
MKIALVAAVADNRVIGRGNALPWRLPEDLKRFKRRTEGHTVIMGRRTWESIGGALPNRECVVVTRKRDYHPPGARIAGSLEEALHLARESGEEEVFILGGAEIYTLALPDADRMYLTMVHADVDGDTHFPEYDPAEWTLIEEERHDADDRHAYAFTFRTLERRG